MLKLDCLSEKEDSVLSLITKDTGIRNKPLVVKLGGSVIAGMDHLEQIAELVGEYADHYRGLVVVVSAFKGMTDELLTMAHSLDPDPAPREVDMLVSVGERITASLLCIALHRRHYQVISYTGSQAGILTSNDHTQARIIGIQPKRIEDALANYSLVVVAGFQGVSATHKEITTLGRGGSDTSAVALAVALRSPKVIFLKDVGALFDQDPRVYAEAKPISFCSYQEALSIMQGHYLLHPRAVAMAQYHGLPLHITSVNQPFHTQTLISTSPDAQEQRHWTEEVVYES